jgi:hypothetical protein
MCNALAIDGPKPAAWAGSFDHNVTPGRRQRPLKRDTPNTPRIDPKRPPGHPDQGVSVDASSMVRGDVCNALAIDGLGLLSETRLGYEY